MTTITIQQARERYKTLPSRIQEAIFSVDTSEIIWKVGEQNNLDEIRIGKLTEAVGLALLGFIHPEDMVEETKSSLGIDSRLANDIYQSLDRKLFAPLKLALAQIYSPSAAATQAEKPAMVEEIKKPEIKPVSAAVPAPPKQTPLQAPPAPPPAPKAVQPAPTYLVEIKKVSPPPVPPAPKPTMTAPAPQPAPQSKPPLTGMPLSTLIKKIPAIPTPPTPPPAEAKPSPEKSSTPPPVIIHQESEFQPIKPKFSSFSLEREERPAFEKLGEKSSTVPPATARIEISGVPKKIKPKPKVVNYTEEIPPTETETKPANLPSSPLSPPKPSQKPIQQPQSPPPKPPAPQSPQQQQPIMKPPTPNVPQSAPEKKINLESL